MSGPCPEHVYYISVPVMERKQYVALIYRACCSNEGDLDSILHILSILSSETSQATFFILLKVNKLVDLRTRVKTEVLTTPLSSIMSSALTFGVELEFLLGTEYFDYDNDIPQIGRAHV